MVRCFILGAALACALHGVVGVQHSGASILHALPPQARAVGARILVQGEACTDACRREHSHCMIRSKGSPSCNVRLQQCLQACLAGRRR